MNHQKKCFFDYIKKLSNINSDFWELSEVQNEGFQKTYVVTKIIPSIDEIDAKILQLHISGESANGVYRQMSKKVFENNVKLFELIMKHWIENSENAILIKKFYHDLKIVFLKVADACEVSKKEWK